MREPHWIYGRCEGMLSGCAWAQRGDDAETWAHFGSLADARAYAEVQNEREGVAPPGDDSPEGVT